MVDNPHFMEKDTEPGEEGDLPQATQLVTQARLKTAAFVWQHPNRE